MESRLSDGQLRNLTGFLGYGNPSGRFWFMGIEEVGRGSPRELRIRADHFAPVEDQARARTLVNPGVNLRTCDSPVWPPMCRIISRINGDPGWRSLGRAKDYLESQLGRLRGETFLTGVLPLPKRSGNDWPYDHLWTTKDEYVESVLEGRIELLRELHEESNPTYTFCYGKAYWPLYKRVCPDLKFETLIVEDAEIGVRDGSVVVLTRLFDPSYQGFTIDFIDTLISAVEERVGVLV